MPRTPSTPPTHRTRADNTPTFLQCLAVGPSQGASTPQVFSVNARFRLGPDRALSRFDPSGSLASPANGLLKLPDAYGLAVVLTFATSWTDVTVALGTLVTGVGAVVGLYLTAAAAKRERARHEHELADERQASANYLAEQRAAATVADRKRYVLATLSEAATSYGQLAAVASDPARSNMQGILAATLRLKLASLPGQYAVLMRLGLRLPLTPSGRKKLDWLRIMGYLPFDFQPGEAASSRKPSTRSLKPTWTHSYPRFPMSGGPSTRQGTGPLLPRARRNWTRQNGHDP